MTIQIDPDFKWESQVEDHPYRHDWYTWVDYVHERNSRKVLIVMRREFSCRYCNTKRSWLINVIKWEVVGVRYKYDKSQVIVRLSKSEWLRTKITNTTSDEIRSQLRK